MKKFLLLLLIAPVFAFAQQTKPKTVTTVKKEKEFTINGRLSGFPDETEIALYRNGDNKEIANGKLKNGEFVLKGEVKEPVLCYLAIGPASGPVQVFVENSRISVSNDPKVPGKYVVDGSVSHKAFNDFVIAFSPLAQELSSLAGTINSMVPGGERDALMNLYNNTIERIQLHIDSFVTKNTKSVIAPFVLTVTAQFYEDPVLLEQRYNRLDASVKKLESAKQLAGMIAEKKIGAVGTEALDFTQPDTTGSLVSLSSFRGKYVLVDFWASWCGPCRNENPNVVENFHKFKEKNFTILGVSLDRPGQKAKWLQAIKEDNLTWTHVSDLQFWNNAAAQLYHIQGIPQNILIDPSGKIVARNLRGPALEAKLCEIFGCGPTKGF
jgi:peroxiredoxin